MTRPRSQAFARRAAVCSLPVALLAVSNPTSAAQKPSPPAFQALQPGEFVTHALDVPVRIVLIGFEEGSIDEAALSSLLPQAYKPVVRYPQVYGLSGRDLGLEYRFAYRVVRKGPRFEERFFAHLAAIGRTAQRTLYQTLYNAQAGKVAGVEVGVGEEEEGLFRHGLFFEGEEVDAAGFITGNDAVVVESGTTDDGRFGAECCLALADGEIPDPECFIHRGGNRPFSVRRHRNTIDAMSVAA